MTRNRTFFVRLHARLRDDERGFSLLETVIAITVIFGSLITLAMSASTGFRYVGIGREEQAANQVANQLMEQVRGLAFSKIERGMQSSSLSTDPNVVSCSGVYHLISCSGEKIVSTNLNCPTVTSDCSTPIVPNTGTVGEAQDYPVDYTWHSYVTNDCPTESDGCTTIDPYRVTIIVSWEGAGTSADGIQGVTTQSLFHSPNGCIDSSTHPFAAPCQPFYYGQALAPEGQIDVTGTVGSVDFLSGSITTTGGESTMQVEQVAQVQSSWTQTGTVLTTSSGTTFGGAAVSRTTAVDSDPSGTTPNYQVSTGTGTGSNQFAYGGDSYVQVQNSSGDSGQAISATAAGGANACPPIPPGITSETDLQPCGGAKVLKVGTSRVVAYLFDGPDLGATTLASLGAAGEASTTFTDRELISGQDGTIENSTRRTYGTISVGGLPEDMVGPVGWTGSFLQLTGYSATARTVAGTTASAPSASIGAGTITYWNGVGYSTVSLATNPSYSLSNLELEHSQVIEGEDVTVRIATVDTIQMGSVPTTTVSTEGCDLATYPQCKTEAQASVGSPILGAFTYEVWVNGAQTVDLTIEVSLGTMVSKSLYGPTPEAA